MSYKDPFEDIQAAHLKVYKVFNKSEEEVNQDIEIVKQWIQTQPHFPEITHTSRIRNFLIMNKFSIERVKQKIDMYYSMRSLIPDFFQNSNPKSPEMKKCYETAYMGLHPKLINGMHRVILYKLKKPDIFMVRESLLTACNVSEMRLEQDCFFNDVIVYDFVNFSFTDMVTVTPGLLAKAVTIYEKIYSLRIKDFYVVNAPKYIARIVALVKVLLKPKIFAKFHICENEDILKELFTKEDLPKDYGGQGPSLEELTNVLKIKMDEYQPRFDQLDQMTVDENLRPERLRNDEVLGFYGNFKSIDVD